MNAKWWMLVLLMTPALLACLGNNKVFVNAEEDEVEDEDGATVEEEGGEGAEEVVEEDGDKKNVHADADTFLLFTKPATSLSNVALPAGSVVEFLIGFQNKADDQEFVIETLDASFRYPMDFTYHIQNFSAIAYQKTVKPKQEATISYSFVPADAFAGRPIGLTINLAYRDAAGNFYFDPVFNETVSITDYEEGFDTEVFFMYVSLFAIVLLMLFLVYTFVLTGKSSKGSRKSAPAKPVETGTSGDDVDYEWIPRSALRTPGSGKNTPRQRKGKAGKGRSGSDTE